MYYTDLGDFSYKTGSETGQPREGPMSNCFSLYDVLLELCKEKPCHDIHIPRTKKFYDRDCPGLSEGHLADTDDFKVHWNVKCPEDLRHGRQGNTLAVLKAGNLSLLYPDPLAKLLLGEMSGLSRSPYGLPDKI